MEEAFVDGPSDDSEFHLLDDASMENDKGFVRYVADVGVETKDMEAILTYVACTKAPQAPRRFKSPYIHFSISKMAEYNKLGSTIPVTSISGLISEEWKALPTEERRKWDQIALQDKLRYDAEKSMYDGPWQVPCKRPRKDPSAPKRPPSAFLLYCQTERKRLKGLYPAMKNTDISKLLGRNWREAPASLRQPHIEREHRERQIYKVKIAQWREEKEKLELQIRQKREALAQQYVANARVGDFSSPKVEQNDQSPACISEPQLDPTTS
eukprot:scaffold15718_cov126-Cylindrotheca_fusiformis.AAC.5